MDADRIRSAWPGLPSRVKDALVAVCLGWEIDGNPKDGAGWPPSDQADSEPWRVPTYSSTWEGFGALVKALAASNIPWQMGQGTIARTHAVVPAMVDGFSQLAEQGASPPDALSLAFVLSRVERIPEELPLGVEHG